MHEQFIQALYGYYATIFNKLQKSRNIWLFLQKKQKNYKKPEFDSQFEVKATPSAHLEFTIKHEKLNLLLLKTILKLFPVDEIITNIQSNPKM